jgi:uncharacterized protein YggE
LNTIREDRFMVRKASSIVGACLLGTLVAGGSIMADEEQKPSINVAGTGKVSAAPDMARISMGVTTQGDTARAALAANNEAMSRLLEVLKERGVATKDVQTSNISINPQYSQPPQPRPGRAPDEGFVPKIVGYNVNNMVQIKARDLSKLGELLDAVVQGGANQMHGISFEVEKPEKLLDQARKDAMADAKRKAEQLAGEAGVVLGYPLHITESGGGILPQPMMKGRAMMMAAESAVPVSAGEEELSLSVSVVYELKAPK